MTLRQKQSKFARLIPYLLLFAYQRGYELTFGDFWAHDGHIRASFHYKRLAADLNLFIDGKYQEDTEAYRELGKYWKSLDPECTWGGDFKNPDGCHFSYGEKKR